MYINNRNIQKPKTQDKKLVIAENVSITQKILEEMLIDSINDAHADYIRYSLLALKMETEENQELLKTLAYNKYKHRRIFEEIYYTLTGEMYYVKEPNSPIISHDLVAELTDRFFDELEAIEIRRDIMVSIENVEIRDMLFEIITDGQNHAAVLNYILSAYR